MKYIKEINFHLISSLTSTWLHTMQVKWIIDISVCTISPIAQACLRGKVRGGWGQNQSLIYHLTIASRSVSDLYKTWVIGMEIDMASDMPLWFSIEWILSLPFTGVNPFLRVSMSNHYHWGELTPDNDPINRPTTKSDLPPRTTDSLNPCQRHPSVHPCRK